MNLRNVTQLEQGFFFFLGAMGVEQMLFSTCNLQDDSPTSTSLWSFSVNGTGKSCKFCPSCADTRPQPKLCHLEPYFFH